MSWTNWQIRTTVENVGSISRSMKKLTESASRRADSHEKLTDLLENLIKLLKTE